MYHLELRESFHNFSHFNVDEEELRALIGPWVREQVIEFGERKWSPHRAKLRILEGPHLPIEELSMGRGWRTAERQSKDVTERVLAQALTGGLPGADVLSLLGADPDALLAAWRLAARRRPELSPGESLALAEQTLRSLDP